MLLELRLKNFILIEELLLTFEPGFTVLTGETGAGKSLLIKALKLILGERGGPDYIRPGRKEAVVEALIYGGSLLRERLEALGFEPSEEVLLRRVISPERTRVYVNGSPATLKILSQLTRGFIVLTGQHEFRLLFSSDYRLSVLDDFAGLTEELEAYRRVFSEWKKVSAERENLERELSEIERRRDFLDYQIREIEEAGLSPEEDQELVREREVLRHLSRLKGGLEKAAFSLDRAAEALAEARGSLFELAKFDAELQSHAERLENLYYETVELAREMASRRADLPEDDSRLEEIEARLSRLERLKRKYGGTVEEILQTLERLRAERETLETGEERLQELVSRETALLKEVLERAKSLSDRRRKAAGVLSEEVTRELSSLALSGAEFRAEVNTLPASAESLTASGLDKVEFLVRTNPGTPERPLEKVASGGELSRVFLALKCVLSRKDSATCLIFDEVDTGIGGLTAVRVGEKLRELSENEQVICITHLPQIARLADHHFAVEKEVSGGETFTRIRPLSEEEREQELSRMMGVASNA